MSPPSKLSAAVCFADAEIPFRSELSLPEKIKSRKKTAASVSVKKTARRRKIDPTTSNRNYTPEEVEFMNALNGYKRSSGRMFPTCCEILEVLKGLGYEKTLAGIAAADN